jgi:asparagine synthase (glutamine-hydrolysing)
MCGIVGFNNKNTYKLENMLNTIVHRGPDDAGMYESDEVSLGHRRLSILDLSEYGHQPMIYEHIVMVFNGEVYNFKEIQEELIVCGYAFKSDSDSEVILKAFHKWGLKAVDKFIGMFAIALYDKHEELLYLIRDRVGVKPLYYSLNMDNFVFASEMKPIMEFYEKSQVNKEALFEYFQYGYISSNLSIIENCYKVPPGHYLTYDIKHHKVDISRYWNIEDFFLKPKFEKTEKELTDELEELLIDAFKYRMVSDVPVGVFLSGGVDSSIVAAILQKHHGNIHTFTIGFKEEKYNEAVYARDIAKYLGTTHTEEYLDSEQAKQILIDYVNIYDEPFGDSSGIPTTLVSQLAKRSGIKVVLSADGGDEIFCGYSRYWKTWERGKNIFKIPSILRQSIVIPIAIFNNMFPSKLSHKYKQLKSMFLCKNWQCIYENMIQFSKKNELRKALDMGHDIVQPSFKIGEDIHPMQGMMLWDYHRYMVDDILTKVDRATMSVSIEGREPLLDHRIAEFMAQVPFKYKYKDGTSKYLLRKVLERYIPNELIDRPKMGFGIPLFEWFRKDLFELFETNLTKEKIDKHGLYRYDFVEKHINDLKNGNKISVGTPWLALVFELWYKKYMK